MTDNRTNNGIGNSNEDNSKKLDKLMERFKDKIQPTEEQLKRLKELANQYSDKSEEELIAEIIKLNKIFSQNMSKEEYQDKIKKLERIRPLLNEEQRAKLDKVLKIIKEIDS